MTEQTENTKPIQNDEIDLVEVFKKIWASRKIIYKSMAICFVIGLIVAFGTPKEYKSEVTLLVETGSGSNGMSGLLQQFGGLAGINLGGANGGADALRPDLYPDVIKSTPFLLEVLDQKVTESIYDSTLTVSQYLDRQTRSLLFNTILDNTIIPTGKMFGWFGGNQNPKIDPLKYTPEQSAMNVALVICLQEKQEESKNTQLISFEMQEIVIAAQLNDSVVQSLTKYITEDHTQKAMTALKFIVTSHNYSEGKYKQTQQVLSLYTLKNIVLTSESIFEERLQENYKFS